MTENGTKKDFTGCAPCYHSRGVEMTIENGRAVDARGRQSHPFNKGKLCPKGQAATEHLCNPDRTKYPLKKVNDEWTRISFDQAFSEIAATLKRIEGEICPSVIAFFCGFIAWKTLTWILLINSMS